MSDQTPEPRPKRTRKETYRMTWDVATIPDEVLQAEAARRRGVKGGRPKVLKPCRRCGHLFSARELRSHKCEGRPEELDNDPQRDDPPSGAD